MICTVEDCTEHYGCRLRAKNIGLSSTATPTRTRSREHKFRPMQQPSWEKGIAGEHRPDGSFMPLLNEQGNRMGVYEAQTRTHAIAETRRRYASTTHPLED